MIVRSLTCLFTDSEQAATQYFLTQDPDQYRRYLERTSDPLRNTGAVARHVNREDGKIDMYDGH